MNFQVVKPFQWQGYVRTPGQVLALDVIEAGRLRKMGLIGQAEQATAPPAERAVTPKPERAVKPPGEKRAYKPRKKKAKDVVDADSAAGD